MPVSSKLSNYLKNLYKRMVNDTTNNINYFDYNYIN